MRDKPRPLARGLSIRARALIVAGALGAAAAITIVSLVSAGSGAAHHPRCTPLQPGGARKHFDAPPCSFIDESKIYTATLDTSLGTIHLTLDPRLAPATINNFVFLAQEGFFDGTTFHRVENASDHAIVQGGDPTGTGRGGPGYVYQGEQPSPITRYRRGMVAMANTGSPASNGSQFFIVVRDWAALGEPRSLPNYTFFAIVGDDQSLAVLDRMVSVTVNGVRPVKPIVLRRVVISSTSRDTAP